MKESPRSLTISVHKIRLLRASFELNPDFEKTGGELDVGFEFDVQRTFPTPSQLEVIVSLSLFKGEEAPPFVLDVAYQALFSVEGEQNAEALRRFARYNAPGMLIPYLREIVTTVSARSAIAALVMPPIDVQRLIDELEKGRAEGTAEAQPSGAPRLV